VRKRGREREEGRREERRGGTKRREERKDRPQDTLKLTSAKEEMLRCFFIAFNFSRSSDNCKRSKVNK